MQVYQVRGDRAQIRRRTETPRDAQDLIRAELMFLQPLGSRNIDHPPDSRVQYRTRGRLERYRSCPPH